jgi:polyisoprenoid-binding protein YceI
MKKFSGLLSILVIILLASCNSGPKGEKAETGDALTPLVTYENTTSYVVDTSKSVMKWIGSNPAGEHNGTVKFMRGFLKVADDQLLAGNVMVDMKSIDDEDLNNNHGLRGKLVKHLKSKDFFDVNSFPEALFQIVSVESLTDAESQGGVKPTHKITGNLTIRGITKSIAFNANIKIKSGKLIAETSQFIIDRTDWDITYKSNKFFDDLKDQFINDEIGLIIELVAKERN